MRLLRILALCAITVALPSAGWAEEEEVEALARGAVHEAYAEPSERQPVASPVIAKEPPKPIEELPPDQKPEGENVQWIPGYWSWDEDRKDFVWISGFWRVPPPDRTWMPGSWQKTAEGWQWSGGFWAPVQEQKADIEYLPQPPKPLDDAGANVPAPAADHIYVPGSWVYRTRYVWRPGYWTPYRTNWIWQSAHYRWTPGGYVFIDGYWDYPLANRGVLFAPCYIPPVVYAAPAYVYTPTIIVREPCLYGAFFSRRGYGSYYFGDYFAPNYATIGFTAWSGHVSATVRLGGYHDPLFSHYSVVHARDPFWGGGGLNSLYVGRYRGDFARPPVNFRQQNVVINNIRNTNVTNVTNVNNVQMLSTLRDAPTNTNVRLARVPEAARREEQTRAREIRTVASSRAEQEVRLVAAGPMKGPAGPAAPRTLKVDVPQTLRPRVATPVIDPVKPGQVLPKADRPLTNVPPMPKVDPKVPTPDPKERPTLPIPKKENPGTPKVDPRPVPNPMPNPMPKVDPKPVPNPMPKVDPKGPTPKIDLPRPVPNPMPKVDPKPVPNPTPKIDLPKPVPNPVPNPAPKVEPRPVPNVPKADPRPVPNPVPSPQPKIDIPKPLPKVEIPKPLPNPVPTPLPKPDPRPVPLPPAPVNIPKPVPLPPAPVNIPKPLPAPAPKPAPLPPAPVFVPKPAPLPPAPVFVPKPVALPPAPVPAPRPAPAPVVVPVAGMKPVPVTDPAATKTPSRPAPAPPKATPPAAKSGKPKGKR